jgi:class 3 adenylate cyclase
MNKDIKGKGLMNLYSYSLDKKKKGLEASKNPVMKDQSGNVYVKSSTKNAIVKQNTKNSRRKSSLIHSQDVSVNASFLSNKKSLIEDSMLIVENSQDLLIKNGGNQQDNIFSDLNRFNNDINDYNYGNYGNSNNRKNQNNQIVEKKEAKFEIVRNTYFFDSILFYKFNNDVSRNGFKRFEHIIVKQSKIRSIYINLSVFFLLLFGIYISCHYAVKDSDYILYLQAKTGLLVLLIIFIFLTDRLLSTSQIILFIGLTIIFLGLTANNIYVNSKIDEYNWLNMTIEEVLILTSIESCGIFSYIQITINLLLHIALYIYDIISNRNEELLLKYGVLLITIAVIKLIYTGTLYYEMTSMFLANQKESKALVDTEKMLFNLMPLHVVQNMKDDIPVADVLENVTILFADIVRYTDFGNKNEPVIVVKMLMELFKNFDHATIACHVYKVHTIGDCYVVMGFNGKVSMNERNYYEEAKNVCKMGEEMINIIKDVRKKVNFESLDMRIGIHTGTVIAGIIGSSVVRYDIFGSDVLIANKMESSGVPGKINISEDTKKLLESKDLPFSLTLNKVVHIDAANRDISCYLIDNEKKEN